MSSFTDMQKEQHLANYLQELLSLDRARQQATLENLSRYADASPMAGSAPPLVSTTEQELGMRPGVLKAGALGRMKQEAQPLKVQLPSQDMGAGASSSRLQHATQVLQAALANWEACMQGDEANGQRAQPSPEVAVPGIVPPPGLKAEDERAKKMNDYARTLEKALKHHSSPEMAEQALALLEMAAKEEATKIEAQKLKWLTTLLQTQNQANLDKVHRMLKEAQRPQVQLPELPRGATPVATSVGGLDSRTVQLAMALGQLQQLGAGSPMVSPWPYGMPQMSPMSPMTPMTPMAPPPAAPYAAPGPAPMWWPGERSAVSSPGANVNGVNGVNAAVRKGGGPKKRNPEAPIGAADSHSGDTLRMHLRSLLQVDSSRVLIVRKINRLGFASPQILREHFSWYGTVENVLVAHSRVKSGGGQAGIVSRLRPSGLGFVVMSKGEEALKILAEGLEQQVSGTIIRVQKFERRMSESPAGLEELEAKEQEQEPCSSESRAMGG